MPMRIGLLPLLVALLVPASARAQPPVRTDVTDTVSVYGTPARFTYYFNHNALAGAVLAGNAVIALTSSGNLLRIDATTLTLSAQAVMRSRGTAIAVDDRGVTLVGTEDGDIVEVDPDTLAATLVHRVGKTVLRLTRSAGRLIAVVGSLPPSPWPGETGRSYVRRSRPDRTSVVTITAGKIVTYTLPSGLGPTVCFLDDSGRLWLGQDDGEFGGRLAWMDLATGRVTHLPTSEGIVGFTRAADGRLLAFGGLVHITIGRAFVAVVESDGLRMLWQFEAMHRPSPDMPHPMYSIDHVVEDDVDGGFWVLSAHTLYHASADFATWSKSTDFGGRFTGGRRLSLGNSQTITALLPVPATRDFITASALDGLQRTTNGDTRRLTVEDQLESRIVDIWPTSIGMVFLAPARLIRASDSVIWRLSHGAWSTMPGCPDSLPGEEPDDGVPRPAPVGDDMDGIVTLCSSNWLPGPSALIRTDSQGHMTTLDEWGPGQASPPQHWQPADGQLFRTEKTLHVRDRGRWDEVRTGAGASPFTLRGVAGREYVPLLRMDSRVQLLWSPENGKLLRLDPDPSRLTPIRKSALDNVLDAVPDDASTALVTTLRGVFRYRVMDGRLERIRLPAREQIVTAARDSRGRLWAAGRQLHVSIDDGRHWQIVDLPMMSATETKRLRPNPASPGAMFLSLDDRGLVIIE